MIATKKVLARSALFKGLSDAELNQIMPLCREQAYGAGFSVIAEGAEAKNLFIVTEGRVMVEINLSAYSGMLQNVVVATVTAGELFGWSALVDPRAYTMTVRCLEPTKVIVIDGEQMLDLFNDNPAIGFKVMKQLVVVAGARLQCLIRAASA